LRKNTIQSLFTDVRVEISLEEVKYIELCCITHGLSSQLELCLSLLATRFLYPCRCVKYTLSVVLLGGRERRGNA